jgi:predicted metal-binding transcription factor (methanogenesis marker protein 9)
MVLRRINMSVEEYMDLKKELSEELVGKQVSDTKESVIALSKTFNVTEEEAFKVLIECDNDIKKAAKLLKMKNLEL